MLQIFRDKAQSTFIQAVVLVIALVFVFWGVGANMMDSREAAIVVNDEEISFQTYQRSYDKLLSTYRQQFGGSVPEELLKSLGLSQQVQTQLIQQALLRQGSESMGLRVSAPEVQQTIQKMVQFQENDAFSMEKYEAILQSSRLTPHKFENSMRYDTLSNKGVQAIGNFVTTVTEAEINDMVLQTGEKVIINYVQITPEKFTDDVSIEENELIIWYGKNAENYKTAPQVKLKYLSFPHDKSDDSKRAETFQTANTAYEGIISSGSLQAYAEQQNNANILESEFFSRIDPPKDFDTNLPILEAVFSLKSGELSSLIESPAGYTILYAEAIKAPEIPPLDMVRTRVTVDYTAAEAANLAQKSSTELLKALQDGADFTELAKEKEIELKEATISRSTKPDELNGFPGNLARDVFSLHTNNTLPDEPAKNGTSLYLYQFSKRTLPEITALPDEEKEKIVTQIMSAKRDRLLVSWIRNQERAADIFTNRNIR